ncbi:MAG: hypothetical protein GY719_35930 [bacterium]|nr:hypothetical protein [bacterium]
MAGVRHALLIGIDKATRLLRRSYERHLRGCASDLQRMLVLLSRRGFRAQFRLNQQASRAGILSAVDELIKSVDAGDTVVLYYAGRGSRVQAEEWSHPRQTIVPYDTGRIDGRGRNRDIFDLEMDSWIARLAEKKARVTAIFDTSPSGVHEIRGRVNRSLPVDDRPEAKMKLEGKGAIPGPILVAARAAGDGLQNRGASGWLDSAHRTLVLAACGPEGRAREVQRQKIPCGAFTYLLSEVLGREEYDDIPWEELRWPAILKEMEAEGLPTGQVPLVDGWNPAEAVGPPTAETKPPRAEPLAVERYALLIGVEHYPLAPKGFDRLNAPLHDVQRMHEVLSGWGFQIRILLNEYATRSGIIAAVEELYDVPRGSTVHVHFSGHGSQVEGEDWARTFNTIVPYNSGRVDHPNRDIFDTEIDLWIKHLNKKTSKVTLTFDSCHSGDVSRAVGSMVPAAPSGDVDEDFVELARSLPADRRLKKEMFESGPPEDVDGEAEGPVTRGPAGWLLGKDRTAVVFAACGADQKAWEAGRSRVTYGRFTYSLTEALEAIDPTEQPWEEIAWLPISEAVIDEVKTQTPVLESLDAGPRVKELTRHAVLIGIDDYSPERGLRPLKTPVADAEALKRVLVEEQGYPSDNVHLLKNEEATRDGIRKFFTGLRESKKIREHDKAEPNAAVLLYFAGHGEARTVQDEFEGFLLPQDAHSQVPETWLPMTAVAEELKQLGSRHLLLVLDCCFAGSFNFTRGGHRRPPMSRSLYLRYLQSHTRQLLSSAAHNQLARDVGANNENHSPFAAALLEGLKGEADLIGDGVITSTELFQHIESKLMPVPGGQVPGLSHLSPDSTGQYVFFDPRRTFALDDLKDPKLDPSEAPWRGLEVYGDKDADLFFGRDAVIQDLLALVETLHAHSEPAAGEPGPPLLLALVGASGSGKSSLVKAGLRPELSEDRWRIVEVPRLSELQVDQLGQALLPAGELALAEGQRRLLFVDQLEELYTSFPKAADREAFLTSMSERMDAGDRFLVTLRSDFQSRLTNRLGDRVREYRIPDLDLDELREVIERPAEERALFFEQDLVDRIVEDVRNTSWPLPQLSVALADMFGQAHRRLAAGGDRELTHADYETVEGVAGALRTRASGLYAKASASTREILRRLLLRLVSLEGGHRTRRRVHERELVFGGPEADRLYEAVLEDLIRNRLLVRDGPYVEPANNAVIQQWDDWLDEQWDLVQLLREVWRAALAWKESPDRALWNDDPRLPQLREKDELRPELNEIEREFAAASFERRKEELEEERRLRRQAVEALAQSAVGYAQMRLERQQWTRALAFLARALRLTPDNTAVRSRMFQILTHYPNLKALVRHGPGLSSVAFSPDGERLVTATAKEGTVRLWSAHTGEPVGSMRAEGAVGLAGFSSDGRLVTVGDGVAVWDLETGEKVAEPFAPSDRVDAEILSPDGRRLAGRSSQVAKLWDVEGARQISGALMHEHAIHAMAFSTDSEWLVTSSNLASCVWNAKSGQLAGGPLKLDGFVHSAHAGEKGLFILAVKGSEAQIWDSEGEPVSDPMRSEGEVESAVFDRYGERILIAADDGTALMWGWGRPPGVPIRHARPLQRALLSRDGLRIAAVSSDDTVRVWDAAMASARGERLPRPAHAAAAAPTPDDLRRALPWPVAWTADGRRAVKWFRWSATVWDLEAREPLTDQLPHEGVESAALSPDGSRVLTVAADHTAYVWAAATGKRLGGPLKHVRHAGAASFSADGERLLTVSDQTVVRAWHLETGKPASAPIERRYNVQAASFSPDGTRIMVLMSHGPLLWDVASWSLEGRVSHSNNATGAAFSPDGTRLVTSSLDRTARVWDTASRKPVGLPLKHEAEVRTAVFSPDGQLVVTTSGDARVRVWDASTGRPVGEPWSLQSVPDLAWFAPDGLRVLAARDGAVVRAWDVLPGADSDSGALADLAELVAGMTVTELGDLEPISAEELLQRFARLRRIAEAAGDEPSVARFVRWYFAHPWQRTVSPLSPKTADEYLELLLDDGEGEAWREAMAIFPGHPLLSGEE